MQKSPKWAEKHFWPKIDTPIKKVTYKSLKRHIPIWPTSTPLEGVGVQKCPKRIFGDFDTIFGGFSTFTEKNECDIQIQHEKIFKIPNFEPGAKNVLCCVM